VPQSVDEYTCGFVLLGIFTVKYLRSEQVTVTVYWSSRPLLEIVCCVLKLVPHSTCMSQHLHVAMLHCFLGHFSLQYLFDLVLLT